MGLAGSFSILVRIDLLLGVPDWLTATRQTPFQYPRADRLIVGVQQPGEARLVADVSVSSCGSTYCWGIVKLGWSWSRTVFQYPRADRLIVGEVGTATTAIGTVFQYPRADRLIVGVRRATFRRCWRRGFSILVRIDLLLGIYANNQSGQEAVSVSSCGSTYCWGRGKPSARRRAIRGFSILVRIDLLLGAAHDIDRRNVMKFQYPRADRLIVGECQR